MSDQPSSKESCCNNRQRRVLADLTPSQRVDIDRRERAQTHGRRCLCEACLRDISRRNR